MVRSEGHLSLVGFTAIDAVARGSEYHETIRSLLNRVSELGGAMTKPRFTSHSEYLRPFAFICGSSFLNELARIGSDPAVGGSAKDRKGSVHSPLPPLLLGSFSHAPS